MACMECSKKGSWTRYLRPCKPCLNHPVTKSVTKSCVVTGVSLCVPCGIPLCIFYCCDRYICCKCCRPKSDISFLTMFSLVIIAWMTNSFLNPETSTIFALMAAWAAMFAIHVHGRRLILKMSSLSYLLVPVEPPSNDLCRNPTIDNYKNHIYYCCGMILLLLLMFNVFENHPGVTI